MQVARWGNSLAIRIPSSVARRMDLKEGDDIQIVQADAETLALADRRAFEERMKQAGWNLPAGWKVDREELYDREGRDHDALGRAAE